MTRNERRRYRKKMTEQKLMGLLMLACCGVILWLSFTGKTIEDRDCTAVLLFAPLGFWMLFSRKILIY